MTEREWLACKRPDRMLAFCGPALSQRKCRLFACACCRRVWKRIDPRCRPAVGGTEQFADGLLGEDALAALLRDVYEAERDPAVQQHSPLAVRFAASQGAPRAAHHAAMISDQPRPTERAAQANLLRDIVGNPFRLVNLDAAWLTPTVLQIAQPAYDERHLPTGHFDPARLAVLSDALEEADCTDAEILDHLRGPGPHTRGSWVLDLLTGRS